MKCPVNERQNTRPKKVVTEWTSKCRQDKAGTEQPQAANSGPKHGSSKERAVGWSWTSGHLALTLPRGKFHLSRKEEEESQPSLLILELPSNYK